jgi:pimeloyl-ACP methyl ester carboxylesterase
VFKAPLVFLPGLLNDASLWHYQIEHYIEKHPLFVPNFTPFDSIEKMAENVLKTIEGNFYLIGLSMGGYVAFEILRQAENRVLGVVLCNTSARADTKEQKFKRMNLIELAEVGEFQGVTPRLLPSLLHEKHIHNEHLRTIILHMAKKSGKNTFIKHQQAIMNRPDSLPLLPFIKCPTLIIGSEDDIVSPLYLQKEIASLTPHAALIKIHDVGHLSPLENPLAFNQILEGWLVKRGLS